MTSELTRNQKQEIQSMIENELHRTKMKVRSLESDISILKREIRSLK